MKHTKLGKHIYAVGSNETSARLAGINVTFIKTIIFTITGLMCGLAAVIYASRMTAVAASNAGLNFEMDAIAAVAIGGNLPCPVARWQDCGHLCGRFDVPHHLQHPHGSGCLHIPERCHLCRHYRHCRAAAGLPEP